MAKYTINIVKISKDKKRCIDNKGNEYTLNQIRQHIKDSNVHIVNNKTQEIRWKKNCKPKSSITNTTNNRDVTICKKIYKHGNRIFKLYFISEDKSSGLPIINNIINKFAEDNKITIECTYITTNGFGNINKCIYGITQKDSTCIVMYDTALQNSNVINNINNSIKFMNTNYNTRIIQFKPRCSEECALSFIKLATEIKGISNSNMCILKAIANYKITGNDYLKYDFNSQNYMIGNNIVDLTKMSKYFKNKKVNNIERYLAEILLDITYNNPYIFQKRANECWVCNCKDNCTIQDTCILEKVLGKNRPNSPVKKCNKTLLNSNKTKAIIEYSLFGIVYEILNIIINGKSKVNINILNNIVKF